MDHVTLQKKLSTYLSDKGRLHNLPDELLCEVLHAWEGWSGSAKNFYKSVGFSHRQMAGIIGKAKKLKRGGYFPVEPFTELKLEGIANKLIPGERLSSNHQWIELEWQPGKVIRFLQVEQLVSFLKIAA